MQLSTAGKRLFARGLLAAVLAGQSAFAGRVAAVYPLFGLKWCLILLNEFLPADFLRRQFAAKRRGDRPAVQSGATGQGAADATSKSDVRL